MAKKQTRRSVSLPGHVYDALMKQAEQGGLSASEIVCRALRVVGVVTDIGFHQSRETMAKIRARRTELP